MINHIGRTFALLFGSTADLHENTAISVEYYDEWKPIHYQHAEQCVGNFVHIRREEVESYTLGVTSIIRMRLEMKHQHLWKIESVMCLNLHG